MTAVDTTRFARLALDCIDREYPNKIAHVLASDEDVRPPRALTPAFYGCFDWHSAVHGHWLLVRLLRLQLAGDHEGAARDALARHLSAENLAAEAAYLARDDRASFERPYGLAWLLQLATELRQWDDADARRHAAAIAPLERIAADRIGQWARKLTHPVRVGEHAQSAFGFALALDWAHVAGDEALAQTLRDRALALHGHDRGCTFALEPSGQDFLSPCLAAADLMRRVLPPEAFARWLAQAFADPDPWSLQPAVPSDRSDGKLVHLDGLNLSRAWMLEGIAAGLPRDDRRRAAIEAAAARHEHAGLAAVDDTHYEGGHWLGSFAVYLVTGRGLASR
ncbi:MAG: DUF2891 domain-containing protein [Nannocystaceae bacterium]|nr:DUF2891 domain-containing protein [Nannocystaceae bacterium]